MLQNIVLAFALGSFSSRMAAHATEQLKVTWPTQHGLIIDAGSTGSRMHVYQWNARRFKRVPPPLSYPLTSNRWTDRLAPGISAYAKTPGLVGTSLEPLIAFAKEVLTGKEHQFEYFPIYLKATGGMRQLPPARREAVIAEVRNYLSNKTLCPFYFEKDFARVISGEEEGIYGWTAINFLLGKLLPATAGSGTVDANSSVGALDLGGASAQISFFVPDQDILANMFKLQIGGQKHWNVYTHSFLYFGVNSARYRLHLRLVEEGLGKKTLLSPCLPAGYSESFDYEGQAYRINGTDEGFGACMAQAVLLLRKDLNAWCNFAHNSQCSLGGVYQPDLPPADGSFGEFYGFGTLKDVWKFAEMPQTANMTLFRSKAQMICEMNWRELQDYNSSKKKKKREKKMDFLAHYCFMSAFSYALVVDGYGFEPYRNLTIRGKIDGLKVTWALGAMLYEINALPWEYLHPRTWVNAFVGSFLLNIVLAAGLIYFLWRSHRTAQNVITRRRTLSQSNIANGRKDSPTSLRSSGRRVGSSGDGSHTYQPIV